MSGTILASGENQPVTRAIEILNLLADNSEPLGVREIARRLDLAPSNVQRLIKTLAKAGFLEQTEGTLRYKIGYRAFQVGSAFVGQNSLYSAVMPKLYTLASQHITAFLGVRRNQSVVLSSDGAKRRAGRDHAPSGIPDASPRDRHMESTSC